MSASITVTEHMNVTCGSQNFLRNTSNKEQLIKLLSNYMCLNGYHVVQCTGDADTSIVEKAIQYAHDGKTVVVAADDTDVLVLLIYHWHDGLGEIFFSTERKEGGKRNKLLKSWSVKDLVESCEYPEYILFAHAWGGCDTTSAIFKKGK